MGFMRTESGQYENGGKADAHCPACGELHPFDIKNTGSIVAFEAGGVYAEFSHQCKRHDKEITLWVKIETNNME